MGERTEIDVVARSRLLRLPEVLKIVAMGKTNLYRKVADGSFPKPIRLSERRVRWVLVDVLAWVESLRRLDVGDIAEVHGASGHKCISVPGNRKSDDRKSGFVIRQSGDRRRT